jgi:lipoate synthase
MTGKKKSSVMDGVGMRTIPNIRILNDVRTSGLEWVVINKWTKTLPSFGHVKICGSFYGKNSRG